MVSLSGYQRQGLPPRDVGDGGESYRFYLKLAAAHRRDILGFKPEWEILARGYDDGI
jgi:hypothetical protein